jgi:membrane-associated phospholipid phosphatase
MRSRQHVSTATEEDHHRDEDPLVEAHSQAAWRRWLDELGREDPERVAGFGVVVAVGFVLGIGAMYAFLRLADEVLEQQTTALDQAASALILSWQSPAMDVVMRAFSLFGSEVIWLLGALLLALFAWQQRWGAAVLLLVVVGGAQLMNNVLKASFQRARPIPVTSIIVAQQYSFPSGHAMMSAAFYAFLAYLVWRLVDGAWRWVMLIGLALLVLAIGVSRIYLQAHYLTDVLAGYVAGLLWADAVILGSRILTMRHSRTLHT